LTALAISPDGRLVAAGDIASRLHVWNLVTGAYWTQKIAKPLTSMVFVAPERLITGDEAGQLQFWNIAERTAATLQAHSERRSVRTLATFASGRLLASIGDDGQVKIWPIQDGDLRALACRRAERKLRADEWRDLFTFAANIDVCGGEPSAAAAVPTTDSRGQPAAGPLPVALSAAHVATIGGNQDGKWSGLPLIYSFEALSGTIVAPGAPVLLRWTTQNAGGGVFLGVNGSEPQPVASPGQQTFTFAADSLVRLTAHNDVGTQSMDIRIDVLGVPPGE
jgi:hypothetical protein